jgi:DNA-directed RNA polymerase specialized sigma24 family protein
MTRRQSGRRVRTHSPGPSDWQPAEELCAAVWSLARRWSRDRPDAREDLAQEALLAIWFKGETDAPLRYQLRTAQNRMLSVRKLGKSVDGKLDASYHRTRRYAVVPLGQRAVVGSGDMLPLHDVLPSTFLVERYVVSKLRLLELLSVLATDERVCVALLCAGFTPREIVARTQSEPAAVMRTLRNARRKLYPLLYPACNGVDAKSSRSNGPPEALFASTAR